MSIYRFGTGRGRRRSHGRYAAAMRWPERLPNPIAPVVAALLESQRTHHDSQARKSAKWRLVRGLYERGLDAKRMRQLFRLIDWLLDLPAEMEEQLRTEIREYEESRGMPYIPTYERAAHEAGLLLGKQEGREEGRQEGRLLGVRAGLALALKAKFGAAGQEFARELDTITDLGRLDLILDRFESARSLDELRELISET